jgi:Uma2 family endonuclease
VLVPDLAGWHHERLDTLPDAAFTLAPGWVCEVLSPRTREFDLIEKRDLYAATGVAHLWLVDPEARTLGAFALEVGRWVLVRALHGEAEVALPPFAAAPFDLAAIWA